MDRGKLWKLIGAPGLAVMSLLVMFLLLGRQKAGATQDRDSMFSGIGSTSAAFTVSGTIMCGATGPISEVEVSVWDRMKSTMVTSDTTDSSGSYSVMLDGGIYYVEFIPPVAAGFNARAFTTMEIMTDSVLEVDFCVCSGFWIKETVDRTEDVGLWTSLALAPTYPYTPHISYYQTTSHHLKYAWLNDAAWLSEMVDSGDGATSLALAPTYPYSPCISYDSRGQIYLACRKGVTWTTDVVPYTSGDCCPSLVLEPLDPYSPHIGYYHKGFIPDMEYTQYHAYLTGTTWCSGTWVREWVEPPGAHMQWFSALALESTYPYTPHMSYHDYPNRDLRYAWKSDTIWVAETVDSAGDVGAFSSPVLDSIGNPHISYLDETHDMVKYALKSDAHWVSETVDEVGYVPHTVWHSCLELNQADVPYISYYEGTTGDLKLARFDGKVWIIQTVDSAGDVGQYSSLSLDPFGCPHISYYDATNGDLKYAYVPPQLLYLPLVMRSNS